MDTIRLIIADDEDVVVSALSDVIAAEPGLELVGFARDADDAIALAVAGTPDVALVDVRMPRGGGARAAREIVKRSPGTSVVAFSGHDDSETVLAMFRAGAAGFVAKDGPMDDVVLAIRRAAAGRATISIDSLRDVAEGLVGFHLDRETLLPHGASERIARAIEDDVVQVVFQPIVELSSRRIVGLEALARFATTPRRPPDVWFAEARRVGLLTELELVAVRRALGHLEHLPQGVYLSVNVSPDTLGSGSLLEVLREAVAERIVIEMTEQSSVSDYDALNVRLRPIRDLGARLAIDDVGSGYATLRHLIALDPDLMKIDRTLVSYIDADPVRRALLERLVSFAHEVGMEVVAEGVETEAELEVLRTLGVPYVQGYYLGRPGPIPLVAGTRPLAWPGRHGVRSEEPVPAASPPAFGRSASLGIPNPRR